MNTTLSLFNQYTTLFISNQTKIKICLWFFILSTGLVLHKVFYCVEKWTTLPHTWHAPCSPCSFRPPWSPCTSGHLKYENIVNLQLQLAFLFNAFITNDIYSYKPLFSSNKQKSAFRRPPDRPTSTFYNFFGQHWAPLILFEIKNLIWVQPISVEKTQKLAKAKITLFALYRGGPKWAI